LCQRQEARLRIRGTPPAVLAVCRRLCGGATSSRHSNPHLRPPPRSSILPAAAASRALLRPKRIARAKLLCVVCYAREHGSLCPVHPWPAGRFGGRGGGNASVPS
jgi:hypothetical protein